MNDTMKRMLAPYASLKLTVALLAMSTFLVFAGTVAQVDKGIWTVVDEYFRCAFAWIDLQIFFPRDWDVPGGFWFPGGWLLGAMIFVNLIAAHMIRFQVKASGQRLLAGLLVLAAGVAITWLIINGVFDQEVAVTENAAFWRVLLRLGKGGGAALVLMFGCMLLFRRRAGVVLLHSGIALLLISEFVTGTTAIEGRMRINAGEAVNFVEHMRSVELTFIDRSDPDTDHVTVVPMRHLQQESAIDDPLLPVRIDVLRFMDNSRLLDATKVGPHVPNLATTGSGMIAVAAEEPEVSGTDVEQTINIPSMYASLTHPSTGASLGTYLLTPWLKDTVLQRQTIRIDDRAYDVELRFARTYKPYSIELIEFRHETYVGTEKPKDFSSVLHLVDAEHGVDRTVKIWMNNPLRYAGETFYQSSFEPGKNLTILQVVRNKGWMIPYLSCMIVGAGMTLHMGSNLTQFLRRSRTS